MTEQEKIWQRRKGESSKAYKWFTIYRDMGYNRSIPKVITKCEQINKKTRRKWEESRGEKGLSEKLIPLPTCKNLYHLSSIHGWVKRCIAFDNYMDERLRLQKEQHYYREEQLYLDVMQRIRERIGQILYDLEFDEKAHATSKAHAMKSLSQSLDTTFKDLRLASGKSTENNSSNVTAEVEASADVRADVNVKETLTDKTFMKKELEFMKELTKE